MSEVVVVQSSAPTPESPLSAPTPPSAPSPDTAHDDAVTLGVIAARTEQHQRDIATLTERVTMLEGVENAQRQAITEVVTAVESVAETVEEITAEPENETQPDASPESAPENDTPPGKTHWLKRSAAEWRGK